MTERVSRSSVRSRHPGAGDDVSAAVAASLVRRYAAERRFRACGLAAVVSAVLCLVLLLGTIVRTALPAFTRTMIRLDVTLDPQDIQPSGAREAATIPVADYRKPVREALEELFPDVTDPGDRQELMELLGPGAAGFVRDALAAGPSPIGRRIEVLVPFAEAIDRLAKGGVDPDARESERRVSDAQLGWFRRLEQGGRVERVFDWTLFTNGDSRSPERAGIWSALVGTVWTMAVTLAIAFPLGVGTAIYLEEFAPRNALTALIEVNISNLAAVPSIVFGLLGLAVFVHAFGLPRSVPLVGGMVLALMTMPIVIIASRAALKAVPPSIREAALGIGASRTQTVFHHVVPLAMPGMLTGAILGMVHALGETAPLLMIGMVAFVVDVPSGPLDPATVLPVQIYLWADAPERAFVERSAAAILVLLGILVVMNLLAVALRRWFGREQ